MKISRNEVAFFRIYFHKNHIFTNTLHIYKKEPFLRMSRYSTIKKILKNLTFRLLDSLSRLSYIRKNQVADLYLIFHSPDIRRAADFYFNPQVQLAQYFGRKKLRNDLFLKAIHEKYIIYISYYIL